MNKSKGIGENSRESGKIPENLKEINEFRKKTLSKNALIIVVLLKKLKLALHLENK